MGLSHRTHNYCCENFDQRCKWYSVSRRVIFADLVNTPARNIYRGLSPKFYLKARPDSGIAVFNGDNRSERASLYFGCDGACRAVLLMPSALFSSRARKISRPHHCTAPIRFDSTPTPALLI